MRNTRGHLKTTQALPSATIRRLPSNASSVSRTRCTRMQEPTVTGMLPSLCTSKAQEEQQSANEGMVLSQQALLQQGDDYSGWKNDRKQVVTARSITTNSSGAEDRHTGPASSSDDQLPIRNHLWHSDITDQSTSAKNEFAMDLIACKNTFPATIGSVVSQGRVSPCPVSSTIRRQLSLAISRAEIKALSVSQWLRYMLDMATVKSFEILLRCQRLK